MYEAGPLLFIVGPTGVGKTRLAVYLSSRFNGEVVNADSRQVYRRMDIGTAKPRSEELAQAPHHLLDLIDPSESFSVGSFLSLAKDAIAEIARRGKLPIIAGGTGQYIRALQEDWSVPRVPPDIAFRQAKEREAGEKGPLALLYSKTSDSLTDPSIRV